MIQFTPGPSQLYPGINEYITKGLQKEPPIPSTSHRGDKFKKMYFQASIRLKALLGVPEDYHIVFTGSSTECFNATLSDLTPNKSVHFVAGAFGEKWHDFAVKLGLKTEIIDLEQPGNETFDYYHLQSDEFLQKINNADIICVTHNETSRGIFVPHFYLETLWKVKPPETLLAIDAVSALPVSKLNYQFLDIAFFSVQKAFGLPPGLGVMILSPRCYQRSIETLSLRPRSPFHHISNLIENSRRYSTLETPNVFGIWLLSKVCKLMLEKGIDKIRKEHHEKYKLLEEFVDQTSTFDFEIKVKEWRSSTVITLNLIGTTTSKINAYLKKNKLMVGEGYPPNNETQVRIANFPAHSVEDYRKLVDALRQIDNK